MLDLRQERATNLTSCSGSWSMLTMIFSLHCAFSFSTRTLLDTCHPMSSTIEDLCPLRDIEIKKKGFV